MPRSNAATSAVSVGIANGACENRSMTNRKYLLFLFVAGNGPTKSNPTFSKIEKPSVDPDDVGNLLPFFANWQAHDSTIFFTSRCIPGQFFLNFFKRSKVFVIPKCPASS